MVVPGKGILSSEENERMEDRDPVDPTQRELLNSLTKEQRLRPSKDDIVVRGKAQRLHQEINDKSQITSSPSSSEEGDGEVRVQTATSYARQLRKDKLVEQFIHDQAKKIAASRSNPTQSEEEAVIDIPVQFGKARFAYLNKGIRYFDKTSPWSLARLFKNLIIYEDDDLIIVDKPYGLPCHGGPGVTNCVTSVLPHLEKLLYKNTDNSLHLIHRLDKETTGIMLLGKNKHIAVRLQNMFKNREILKLYWVICLGVPQPSAGLINIPIMHTQVGNIFKMSTKPSLQSGDVARGNLASPSAALTNYTVINAPPHGHCSLVELRPQTGLKHQIRVHMAQGLGCPVLGDHKYSHSNKLAPQIVPPYILKILGIPQSKARHIPMHLHAKQLIIPDYRPGSNLNVTTPPPPHFLTTLRRLKLRK